jgi:hypothetical protein
LRANVLSYLRAYGQSALRRFDRLSDRKFSDHRLRDLIRGAAAVIGRGVESTGVFGWVTGDRLRQVWLILIIKR